MPNLGKRKVANKSNVEQAAHVKQARVAAAAAAAAAAADAAADNAASFASASVSSTASSAATSRALRQLAEYGGVGPQRQPAADGGARARNLPPRLRSPSASPPRERAVRQRTEGAAGPSGGAPRQADRPTRPCARMRHARARRCRQRIRECGRATNVHAQGYAHRACAPRKSKSKASLDPRVAQRRKGADARGSLLLVR